MKYPKMTRESLGHGHYMAFIQLKDIKASAVKDTRTVWSCDELDLWVDYDKDKKPLGIEIIFTASKPPKEKQDPDITPEERM